MVEPERPEELFGDRCGKFISFRPAYDAASARRGRVAECSIRDRVLAGCPGNSHGGSASSEGAEHRTTGVGLTRRHTRCQPVDMTEAASQLVGQYEALSEADRQEVLLELLRRTAMAEHDLPDDGDLVAAADEVFRELDHHENPA